MEVLLIARLPVQQWCCESAGVDYPPWLLSPQSTRDACRWESDGVSLSVLKETKEPQYHRIYNYESVVFFFQLVTRSILFSQVPTESFRFTCTVTKVSQAFWALGRWFWIATGTMKVMKQGADCRFLWWDGKPAEVLWLHGEVFRSCSRQSLWLCNLRRSTGGERWS